VNERSFYVVVYDIVEDRRRLKVAKELEKLGERIQFSVFELYLTPKELEKLKTRLGKLIHKKDDRVRVYGLCASCQAKIWSLGQGGVTQPPGVMVV
jgi:CRISPR-associated protein Cas2